MIQRRTPLRRHTPIKARRATRRRSGRVRDSLYMHLVRTLPCAVLDETCRGPIEASHMGPRPLGRKADDDTTVPFCHSHHECWTTHAGKFEDWTRAERSTYAEMLVDRTRRLTAGIVDDARMRLCQEGLRLAMAEVTHVYGHAPNRDEIAAEAASWLRLIFEEQ